MSHIELLPDDARYIIFYYCGAVTRAAICSVNSRWHNDAIAVSRKQCEMPSLYDYKMIILNKRALQVIFNDYHLAVRHKVSLDKSKNILLSTSRVKYTMCKAGNIDVYNLYDKLEHMLIPNIGKYYIPSLFDTCLLTVPSTDILFKFKAICHTGIIENIAKSLNVYSAVTPATLVLNGIRTCARRGHIHAMKYLLDVGICGKCNHGSGICAADIASARAVTYYCFDIKDYFDVVSKKQSVFGQNYQNIEKYDRAIDFLVNDYLPECCRRGAGDMTAACEYLASGFCRMGNLYGFKQVFEKMDKASIDINEYLRISCLNPVISISDYIIAAGATNIVECFNNKETSVAKVIYLAEKCYKLGLLPLEEILSKVVRSGKHKEVRRLCKVIPFTTEHFNTAFEIAVRNGKGISSEILIKLGCTNYDKKLHDMGIYAVV